VRGIRTILQAHPDVDHVNEVLTMHLGPDFILVNISVDFRNDIPTGTIETVIANIDQAIKRQFPLVKRVFIEAEARLTRQSATA
jgi:divalent metal cation (Fe/Co/Zn/Cd) transporter